MYLFNVDPPQTVTQNICAGDTAYFTINALAVNQSSQQLQYTVKYIKSKGGQIQTYVGLLPVELALTYVAAPAGGSTTYTASFYASATDSAGVTHVSNIEYRYVTVNDCNPTPAPLPDVQLQKKQDSTAFQPTIVTFTTQSSLPAGAWALTIFWGDGTSDTAGFTGPGIPSLDFSHSYGTSGWVSGSQVHMNWGMLGDVGKAVGIGPHDIQDTYPYAIPAMAVDNHVC